MKTIAERASTVRAVLGRLSHQRSQEETVRVEMPGTEARLYAPTRWDQGRREPQEPEVTARGVIRREEVPLLSRYGTSYGLFDEWIADYQCVLKSHAYHLGEYVGDSVRVSGPLTGIVGEIPVMEVTHLQLLKMKWMR